MFCPVCGEELRDDAKFCKGCGNKIESESTPYENQYAAPDAVPNPVVPNPVAPNPVMQGSGGGQMINNGYVHNRATAIQLKTNRGLLKYILLSIITLGIYTQVFFYVASTDINIIASRYDGKKTMNYLAMWEFVPITIGIVSFVWHHRFFARIGDNLHRRGINYSFGASTFWLWGVLGSLIIVGPFVCQYKFCKAMNMLAEDYNING